MCICIHTFVYVAVITEDEVMDEEGAWEYKGIGEGKGRIGMM